ncbi:adaptor protein NBP2 Ecym_4228 [Eremothecium cymbalariae DBVPG|uniref:SH3 domain-containing protein n=1 Tax=Eremothecium cymbalariae (strain CBS 270.75 / DBVPG 7215 / KCTC 17166 / NRRL Y-17582) TaxID=931890 RepID=G8JTE2_ERECY|nr:hypothetical protein Ecym_4228 [Eremothecium cymbalariae DBVPG\
MAKREEINIDHVTSASSDEDYTNTVGYISIKDYAYDESNPLHYGYFEEINMGNNDDSDFNNEYDESQREHFHNQYYGYNRGDNRNSSVNNRHEDGNISETADKRQSIVLPNEYVVDKKVVALYDFVPENDNELELKEGDVIYISYKHGQGWLVAENIDGTRTGLVPEEYVSIWKGDELPKGGDESSSRSEEEQARPFYLTQMITQNMKVAASKKASTDTSNDDEWEDIDGEQEYSGPKEGKCDTRRDIDIVEKSMHDKLSL